MCKNCKPSRRQLLGHRIPSHCFDAMAQFRLGGSRQKAAIAPLLKTAFNTSLTSLVPRVHLQLCGVMARLQLRRAPEFVYSCLMLFDTFATHLGMFVMYNMWLDVFCNHEVTWGHKDFGSALGGHKDFLKDVTEIVASGRAFAAILKDGTVISWGDKKIWWRLQRSEGPAERCEVSGSQLLGICSHLWRWSCGILGQWSIWGILWERQGEVG